MNDRLFSVLLSIPLLLTTGFVEAKPRCNIVGQDWQWFGDHWVASIDYVVVGSPGRQYEVGTGPSLNGTPIGWRHQLVGSAEISAWGIGAIHIRQKDEGLPFKVCVDAAGLTAIEIFKTQF